MSANGGKTSFDQKETWPECRQKRDGLGLRSNLDRKR
jgi:hypothetical protein